MEHVDRSTPTPPAEPQGDGAAAGGTAQDAGARDLDPQTRAVSRDLDPQTRAVSRDLDPQTRAVSRDLDPQTRAVSRGLDGPDIADD